MTMTFLEEQLEKIKKEELEHLSEVRVENKSFATKIASEFDDAELYDGDNYFENAFKVIDEDRLKYSQEQESGDTEQENIETEPEAETNDTVEQDQDEHSQEDDKKEVQAPEPKKISFFDRLLQLL